MGQPERLPPMQLTVRLRECWVLASDLRKSAWTEGWTPEPTLHALVLEHVKVDETLRRRGICKRFIAWLAGDPRYELVIIEGVQNEHLAEALTRWGWPCDRGVMDFYLAKSDAARQAVDRMTIAKKAEGGPRERLDEA